ncbi:Proline iminopeptidase aneH like protein [Verticillium longisporum]|nr:Proline iminopeptidase aneH like protein [Verticillium longisporum]
MAGKIINAAKLLSRRSHILPDQLQVSELFFEVPADYSNPPAGTLKLFGRSVTKHERPIVPVSSADAIKADQKPWLVYLEGGSTPHAANADGPARGSARRGSNPAAAAAGDGIEATNKAQGRIHGEDMRTWFQTYALSIEVYICANKFLMNDFKAAIRRRCVDMLETAGGDAATPEVLRLCAALYAGVPESDLLLKMVFARIGKSGLPSSISAKMQPALQISTSTSYFCHVSMISGAR